MENPKRPEVQPPIKYVNLTVRIPAKMRKAIRRSALENDVSIQDIVIRAFEDALLGGSDE